MLNYEGAKKGFKNIPVDHWSEDEFNLIALELKTRFPKKNYGNFYKLEFTADEVEEAAEAVLPQSRHKSVSDYYDIRRPMFDAFTRLNNPAVKRAALSIAPGVFDQDGRIKWSIQEWEAVILELHAICPTGFAERLKNVYITHVRQAMEVLEIPRRRQFKQIVSFKEHALRIWDDLPEEIRDPSKQDRPIAEFKSGPVMAPPVTSKTKQNPMAAALQKAFTEPPKPVKKAEIPVITEKPRKKRVFWTDEQWLQIAREMYRQDPFGNLLTTTFPRIDLNAIKAAQRKIFTWDNHKALKNSEGLHGPLVAAFAALKEEIANKNGIQVGQVQTEEVPDSDEVPMTSAEKTKQRRIDSLMKANAARAKLSPEERRAATLKGHATRLASKAKKVNQDGPVIPHPAYAAPVQAIEEKPVAAVEEVKPAPFVPTPSAEIAFFGKVLNAAVPLMNVLIDEAVQRLAPSLIAGLLPQLEKSLTGVIERAVAEKLPKTRDPVAQKFVTQQEFSTTVQPVAVMVEAAPEPAKEASTNASGPLSKAELAQYLPQPTEKAKKAKIALLMPPGQQREYVRAAFPEYEFVFIDHGQGIKEAGQNCALFVAVEKFVTGPNQKAIKANVSPEKLKYVDSGLTAIKRQINVWKVQQKG